MFARDRKTPIAEWWWTIDKQLLSALILLMAVGMMLSFAASPPVAERLGLSPWHFIIRHAMFDLLGRLYDVSRPDAVALASVAVDVRVTQIVNQVVGAHAVLPPGALR